MGEAFITRRGGGKAKAPANYMFLQLITSSLTWTVPNDGWYKVWCVGKSGNGGAGGVAIQQGNTYNKRAGGGGGAGGNSGGISVSTLYLKGGTVIPVTVTSATTSFASYLSATAGGNGGNGDGWTTTPQFAAAGGVPSQSIGQGYGGNIINSMGQYGGTGGIGGFWTGSVSGTPKAGTSVGSNVGGAPGAPNDSGGGGGGGAGSDMQITALYYTSINKYGGTGGIGASYPAAGTTGWSTPPITTPPKFMGSGGGGGGASAGSATYPAGAGGLGSPGGIIIEKGV